MPDISPPELLDFVERVLVAGGASDADAPVVAAHLVEANLTGHDSHGVVRVAEYLQSMRARVIEAGAPFVVEKDGEATALIDGGWNFGQVSARRAMRLAIEKARATGVGVVTGRRVAHVGRLGAYVEQAVDAGMIGLVMSSGSPLVAAHGGVAPRLSTNPLAIGIPTTDRDAPFVLDMATSAVAAGTVRLARGLEANVPEGWLLDTSGLPTTDPSALAEGGALLPLGGNVAHKGFGLALAVEALASLLGGSPPVGPDAAPDVGLFVLALDPERFAGRAHLEAGMTALLGWVAQPPYREGVTEILTPGDRSRRYAAERALAIPVDDRTWSDLSETARSVGVSAPSLEPRRRRRGGDAGDEAGADGSPDD